MAAACYTVRFQYKEAFIWGEDFRSARLKSGLAVPTADARKAEFPFLSFPLLSSLHTLFIDLSETSVSVPRDGGSKEARDGMQAKDR